MCFCWTTNWMNMNIKTIKAVTVQWHLTIFDWCCMNLFFKSIWKYMKEQNMYNEIELYMDKTVLFIYSS